MGMVGRRVRSCGELEAGVEVEARVHGAVHVEGTVAEMMPAIGLFWVVSPTGLRKIIEFAEFDVYRID